MMIKALKEASSEASQVVTKTLYGAGNIVTLTKLDEAVACLLERTKIEQPTAAMRAALIWQGQFKLHSRYDEVTEHLRRLVSQRRTFNNSSLQDQASLPAYQVSSVTLRHRAEERSGKRQTIINFRQKMNDCDKRRELQESHVKGMKVCWDKYWTAHPGEDIPWQDALHHETVRIGSNYHQHFEQTVGETQEVLRQIRDLIIDGDGIIESQDPDRSRQDTVTILRSLQSRMQASLWFEIKCMRSVVKLLAFDRVYVMPNSEDDEEDQPSDESSEDILARIHKTKTSFNKLHSEIASLDQLNCRPRPDSLAEAG